MECRVQRTVAMDPIAAAFEELYEKSPIPMLMPHLFAISDGHKHHTPSSSASFIRPAPKPKKKSVLQSLKKLSDEWSLSEQESLPDKSVDLSLTEVPSVTTETNHTSGEKAANEDTEIGNGSNKLLNDSRKLSWVHSKVNEQESNAGADEKNSKTKKEMSSKQNKHSVNCEQLKVISDSIEKASPAIKRKGNNKTCLQQKNQKTAVHSSDKEKRQNNEESHEETNCVNGQTQNGKVYVLSDWNIKPSPYCRGVLVEGTLQGSTDDVLWHSSAVVKRITRLCVLTSTGSTYKLKGRLNLCATLENGFIMPVAMKFRNGFPLNWLEVIEEYYVCLESQENREQLSDDGRSTPLSNMREAKCSNLVSTPTGLVDIESLPQTKSGRRVKPRLAWWMGQRTLVDPVTDKLSIECMTQKAETVLNDLALDVSNHRKPSKQNISYATKMGNNKTESEKLKSDIMNIVHSSKEKHLSKKGGRKPVCYDSQTDTKTLNKSSLCKSKNAKGDLAVFEIRKSKNRKTDKKLRRNDTLKMDTKMKKTDARKIIQDPFEMTNDSEEEITTQKINNCAKKSVRNNSISHMEEGLKKIARVALTDCRSLRHRKRVNYDECVNSNSCSEVEVNVKQTENSISSMSKSKSHHIKLVRQPHESCHEKSKLTDNQHETKCRQKSKRSSIRMEEEQKKGKWSELEQIKLKKALTETNQNNPYFWDIVSNMVGTRTAEDCQEACLREISSDKQKKRRKISSSAVTKNKDILAKVGTLKRKQQLREYLESHNDNYRADLFEASPMKTKALNKKIPRLDNLFSTLTPRRRHQTPNVRYTVSVASAGKTPSANHFSPWVEPADSTKADKYILCVQKKKRNKVPQTHQTPAKPSDAVSSQPVKTLFTANDEHSLFEGIGCIEEEDGEEEEDYYWTDTEN